MEATKGERVAPMSATIGGVGGQPDPLVSAGLVRLYHPGPS